MWGGGRKGGGRSGGGGWGCAVVGSAAPMCTHAHARARTHTQTHTHTRQSTGPSCPTTTRPPSKSAPPPPASAQSWRGGPPPQWAAPTPPDPRPRRQGRARESLSESLSESLYVESFASGRRCRGQRRQVGVLDDSAARSASWTTASRESRAAPGGGHPDRGVYPSHFPSHHVSESCFRVAGPHGSTSFRGCVNELVMAVWAETVHVQPECAHLDLHISLV